MNWNRVTFSFYFPFSAYLKEVFFSELFLSKGKNKVSLDCSSRVVVQPGVLMFSVQSLAGWHSLSPEEFLLLSPPLHHFSLLKMLSVWHSIEIAFHNLG